MIETDSDRHIRETFGKLATALQKGDVDAYRQLTLGPDPFQEALFLQQSLRLRDNELSIALRRVSEENEMATVYYDLVDRRGNVVESTNATLAQESLGWFVEDL